jgi:osmoprotectant transport system permease protein
METGEFDMYPEYTGTGWNFVLKQTGLYDESQFENLNSQYEDLYNMTWTGMYGFNNTYGIAVRNEIADEYNLKTYSDLAAISDQLVFGAEYDFFEREDGFDPLSETYGYQFESTVDLDIGLKYQAMSEKKIDVMNIFTTDGQLSSADVTVLVDDKQFYPSYMCGMVIRQDTLEKYPELKTVFDQVTGIISDSEMADMNYQVETEGKEPKDVAHAFLVSKGLIK